MAKMTEFEFLGNKGNILKISDWSSMILGAFVSLMAFAVGQWIFQKVAPRTPAGFIEPLTTNPTVNVPIVKEVF